MYLDEPSPRNLLRWRRLYELHEESRGEMCTRQQCGAGEQQALQENRTVDARAVCEICFFSGWSDA